MPTWNQIDIMVEAAGVGLSHYADSKQVIDFSAMPEAQKTRKWTNRYTRIAREKGGYLVCIRYAAFWTIP